MAKSVNLPLFDECVRAMRVAEEQANRLDSKPIGTEFLILGILSEDECHATKLLKERGVTAQIILDLLS